MRLQTLIFFYGRRLRTHPVQELLAGIGIAIGVALAFAVLVANSSVVVSAKQIVKGVSGSADFQIAARDSRGFDHRLLDDVRATPGVTTAAPMLEHRAVLAGPRGAEAEVNLVSVDSSLASLAGRLTRSFGPGGLRLAPRGVMLPSETAAEIGVVSPTEANPVRPLPQIDVLARGRSTRLTVAAVLGRDTIGTLSGAQVAVMPLEHLQGLVGLPGRLSRIFVDVEPGAERSVQAALEALAGDGLNVVAADADGELLEQATGPMDQVTGFFAAISALLGLLLAFNAMLLTAPERRRLVSSLRLQGFKPHQVVVLVLSQAVVLGLVASCVGILAGNVLSRGMFSETPDYLAPGFTLGGETIVGSGPLTLALVGGVVASCLAAAPPLFDLRRSRAVDAVFHERGMPGNALGAPARRFALWLSLLTLATATVILALLPELALAASALLALGTLLAIPTAFALVVRALAWLIARVPRLSALTVALLAMRATTLRSLALAATGAVAVFGSVAIGGAREDLLGGIAEYVDDYVATADVWVVNPADNQATKDIVAPSLSRRIERLRVVADAREYQGGFLDMAGRRVWVLARSPDDPAMLPSSSLVDGDLASATRRLRSGGWIGVSRQIADELDAGVGDRITIPTPTGPTRFRVAATTSNLGWAPGAIVLNADDYRAAWDSALPSAIEIDLVDGVGLAVARRSIRAALAPLDGLRVHSAERRGARINESAGQGLERLGQIAVLLLIAAVMAMAAAMGAAIWQRRPALAALRIQSFSPRQLWLLLLLESSVVLGAGGITGAVGGAYGRLGADRFLDVVTGFPVAPAIAGFHTLETLVLVVAAALAIVAVPGWLASHVPPRLGLGNE